MTLSAYLDTNLYFSYFLGAGKESNYPLTQSIFKEIDDGKYNVQVSYLVLQEMLNVLRRKAATKNLLSLDIPTRNTMVNVKSRDDFQKIVAALMKSRAFSFPQKNDVNIEDLFKKGMSLLQKNFGFVHIYPNCGVCGTRIQNLVYKGISPVDIIHVLLANELKCDTFLTLDKGFACLEKDPIIGNIDLQVIE